MTSSTNSRKTPCASSLVLATVETAQTCTMEEPNCTLEEVGMLSSDFSSSRVCIKDDTAFSFDDVQSLIVLRNQAGVQRVCVYPQIITLLSCSGILLMAQRESTCTAFPLRNPGIHPDLHSCVSLSGWWVTLLKIFTRGLGRTLPTGGPGRKRLHQQTDTSVRFRTLQT